MKTNHCKIVDCTIRDGGLVNNWDFSVDFVQQLYAGLNEAGVDYMEIGYKNSPKLLKGAEEAGPWRFLNDDFLRKVIPQKAIPNCLHWLTLDVWTKMTSCLAVRACWI